jgi:hypothetical protein
MTIAFTATTAHRRNPARQHSMEYVFVEIVFRSLGIDIVLLSKGVGQAK